MPPNKIVRGQHIQREKLELANRLRRQMTSQERLLWEQIRARRVAGMHFRRQQVIDGFVVDFYCHAASLVIELDGPIHQQQPEYDAARSEVIAAHDLTVLRFANEEIEDHMQDVLTRIIAAARLPIPRHS